MHYRLEGLTHIVLETEISGEVAHLQVKEGIAFYTFACSENGKDFQTIGKMDIRYPSTETQGYFTGIYLGLFAVSDHKTNVHAEFDHFKYEPKL